MIDTHCHLVFDDLAPQRADVLDRATGAGVDGCITISTTTQDCLTSLEAAKAHERVWCSSGVHPLHAHEGPHNWANMLEVAQHDKCIAWGELGLDNHYDHPPRDVQDAVLAEQLAHIERWRQEDAALERLPVVIHCREAFDELIPVLRESSIPADTFVFHCFTAGEREMKLLLDFGAMVSFTGVVTFKNAGDVRAAAALAPLDRIMVETDAPFLTPAPHRKVWPNEPMYARDIAEHLAAHVYDIPYEEFENHINVNTERFFGIK